MRWLFKPVKEPADPTRDFGEPRWVPPVWDYATQSLNGLQFGDSADCISHFGRAEHFSVKGETQCFVFAASGLYVECGTAKSKTPGFNYVAVLVNQAKHEDVPIAFAPAELCILPGGHILDASATRATAESILGSPHRSDIDDEEEIYWFQRDKITYELEFDRPSSRLRRANIFPT